MSMPQTPEEMKAFNRQMIADFRARDPKLNGRRILLLTTTGARSGQPHTTPMTYVIDGDRVLVIASNAGAVRHPDWYRNLVANPEVTVELWDETFQTRAVVAEGEEYDRLWA
ncbi:MAG TPA: nitroreductase/quinone reductase family protein, partial [Ktedonobacterales bacterium]|nr:nitroreductase/quinone reductase family protein [Ktedonobacterales bacterium]